MFPRLRDAESQLLFVTNAEITLEIQEVLHYKSLSFGSPIASELQTSLCERKGQQVKDIIHELHLYCCSVVMGMPCECLCSSEKRKRERKKSVSHDPY